MLKVHVTILGTGFKRLGGLFLLTLMAVATVCCAFAWFYGLFQALNCTVLPKIFPVLQDFHSWWIKPHGWMAVTWGFSTVVLIAYIFGMSPEEQN